MQDDTENPTRRGETPPLLSRPLVTPIYPSVVYRSDSPDALDAQYESGAGYTYAREGHPNADVLAAAIDRMEGAEGGVITGSGMAAISAVFLGLLKAGDHILAGDQLYGRSLRLLGEDLPRLGFETSLADPGNLQVFTAAIRPNTRTVLIEVVSNPTLRIADVKGITALCRARGITLIIDNTFTTPRGFQPLAAGADVVLHSVTKLLAGHSDVTLGYVAARDPQDRQAIRAACVTWGLTPSPYECWLAERGLASFDLRFERAQQNAAQLAGFLAELPGVEAVIYPGRRDHPDFERATDLLGEQFGNMLSFRLKGGRRAANALVRAVPELAFAPTLGDIGTTLSHPASSSHRALSHRQREDLGISEGFFRVSVGVEKIELLTGAFAKALKAAASAD
jgi:cystathionine gamma-synthase